MNQGRKRDDIDNNLRTPTTARQQADLSNYIGPSAILGTEGELVQTATELYKVNLVKQSQC